jgi:ATP-dependent RNA helicase RhlE
MTFVQLGLCDSILRAIQDKGYTTPTAIQQQAIPFVLSGKDLLAGSQTGTGKTAGFTLPLLQNLLSQGKRKSIKSIRALILTPTRELAAQVQDCVKEYSKYTSLQSAVVFGGVSINVQMSKLKNGTDILVATPGRLLDLVKQKVIDLSHVEILVLDEADRMLDMGFIHDIKRILALLPRQRQNLLFSATFSQEIKKLAEGILHNPESIQATKENSTAEKVNQSVYKVDASNKKKLLVHLIKSRKMSQVLVFTRTKHGANKLTQDLVSQGILAAAIHGNKSQGARTKALADFKTGMIQVLVATDIAARGIDIDQLPFVINFELPNVAEDYVHRIGRTARAGSEGEAISLVCHDELDYLKDIEKLLKKAIDQETVAGFSFDHAKECKNHSPFQKQGAFFKKKNKKRNPMTFLHQSMQGHKKNV